VDLIERIEEIQLLIEEARSVPLTSGALVNREELLELLAQLKAEVPGEIREARWMSRDRDELLERAKRDAQRLMVEAQEQRDRLLSRTEVVAAAEHEAGRIVDEARERAAKLKSEAEDYIDQKLASFELLLGKVLGTVARGRTQLKGDAEAMIERPGGAAVMDPPYAVGSIEEQLSS